MSLDTLFDAATSVRSNPADSVRIRRPDDWHIHLRDGAMLRAVLPFTAAQFARGIVMPNLVPPVTTVDAATAYRSRIVAARPVGSDFEPLMTCYLTDMTSAEEIERGSFGGRVDRGKALSGRRNDQCASWRQGHQGAASGAGAYGAHRHAGPDSRRGHRPRRRYIRSRGCFHGADPVAPVATVSGAESGAWSTSPRKRRLQLFEPMPRASRGRSRRTIW